jgi:tellurite resistance protein
MAADDTAASDRWCVAQGEAEALKDGEGVVREELAAQLVARKAIAIDERDGYSSAGEQSCQRRSGRAGADDRDVDRGLRTED